VTARAALAGLGLTSAHRAGRRGRLCTVVHVVNGGAAGTALRVWVVTSACKHRNHAQSRYGGISDLESGPARRWQTPAVDASNFKVVAAGPAPAPASDSEPLTVGSHPPWRLRARVGNFKLSCDRGRGPRPLNAGTPPPSPLSVTRAGATASGRLRAGPLSGGPPGGPTGMRPRSCREQRPGGACDPDIARVRSENARAVLVLIPGAPN